MDIPLSDPRHPIWSYGRDTIQTLLIAGAIVVVCQDLSGDELVKVLIAAGGIFGPSALLRKLRNKKDEADKGDK